ncbi:hypothetical protein EVAR_60086_1 [Eumeta japonica]|uniref:Uncharacterized protein n=1 Tax=Eumeta variegata TaxID=151549 RepID=A0A4C1YKZ2_EUMVA|nr:hypothetical protein EVAR_60086_1 [Eumeta japonica]
MNRDEREKKGTRADVQVHKLQCVSRQKKGEKVVFVLIKSIEGKAIQPGVIECVDAESFLGHAKGMSIFELRETRSGHIQEAVIDYLLGASVGVSRRTSC